MSNLETADDQPGTYPSPDDMFEALHTIAADPQNLDAASFAQDVLFGNGPSADELRAARAGALILGRFKNIYCSCCGEVKPCKPAEMPADHLNDHSAVDLLCGECDFIVATLHASTDAAVKDAE